MRNFISNIIVLIVILYTTMAMAGSSTPDASCYYPFIGKWNGHAELAESGKPAIKLKMTVSCQKVSAGWAVECSMSAKNKNMQAYESDLMGIDPVTGKGHWYAVTNMGETHDHITQWENSHTMDAHYRWQQDGKTMLEKIVFKFNGKSSMQFQTILTANGHVVSKFSGKAKKSM